MCRAAGGTKGGKGKKGSTFTIDCGKPVEDKIMEIASCGIELGVHLSEGANVLELIDILGTNEKQ
ncbi:hypothetical protein LguiB_015820 [Lonicera macranthoides]